MARTAPQCMAVESRLLAAAALSVNTYSLTRPDTDRSARTRSNSAVRTRVTPSRANSTGRLSLAYHGKPTSQATGDGDGTAAIAASHASVDSDMSDAICAASLASGQTSRLVSNDSEGKLTWSTPHTASGWSDGGEPTMTPEPSEG